VGYLEGDEWEEKNPSRVFEIYERLFELKHGEISVPEFYGELNSLINGLRDASSCYY